MKGNPRVGCVVFILMGILFLFVFSIGRAMNEGDAFFIVAAVILFIVLIAILLPILLIKITKNNKRKEQQEKLQAHDSLSCWHTYGLQYIPQDAKVNLYIKDNSLITEHNGKLFSLSFEKIVASQAMTKNDLLKEEKSVVGRGVLGGVLLGPLGAVIGGMSGIGEKAKEGKYLVINYKNDEETKVIIYSLLNLGRAKDLADKIQNRIIEKKGKDGLVEI